MNTIAFLVQQSGRADRVLSTLMDSLTAQYLQSVARDSPRQAERFATPFATRGPAGSAGEPPLYN